MLAICLPNLAFQSGLELNVERQTYGLLRNRAEGRNTSRQARFSQLMAYLPMSTFRRGVAKHWGDHKVKDFSCLDQFFAMAFGQHIGQCERHPTLANLCRLCAASDWHSQAAVSQGASGN